MSKSPLLYGKSNAFNSAGQMIAWKPHYKVGRAFSLSGLILTTLLISACGGGSSGSGTDSVNGNSGAVQTPAGGTDQPAAEQPAVENSDTQVSQPDETVGVNEPSSLLSNGGDVVLTASAELPQVDGSGRVIWSFEPVLSGRQLEVMPFVEMPMSDGGRPARWNDMEYTGERLFVSNEHDGKIYEITGRDVRFWFDTAESIQSQTGRELDIDNPWHGGLRGFAFHPDFASNGKFYASMMQERPANPADFTYLSDRAGPDVADSVLVEWTANPATFEVDSSSYREVFRVGNPQYDHPIKQIGFNPYSQAGDEDFGLLYVAHGDGNREGSTAGDGEANDALGKILRINPMQNGNASYSVPGSNPFVGNLAMADEVYSLGHRNPHHIAFLRDGRLLATESGHDNIDEINLVDKGKNYGWYRREGAYVHLDSGTLLNGIATLPDDDAANGLTYPVIQYGHSGDVGATFVGQALGGGFVLDNGSELEGEFFYVDFVNSGRLFHSSINSIISSQTEGAPSELTMAQTFEASVMFDHDGNENTAAIANTMPEVLQSTGNYDGSGRVDIRIGQGPLGEMYLLNKRNSVIYLVRNSYPPGQQIPEPPVLDANATTMVNFNITVPAYMSDALQVRVFWGDQDLNAAWVVDETWAISGEFPIGVENRLVVEFNDGNGTIPLGRYERVFRTEAMAVHNVQIAAADFDTTIDDDLDGISNIDELVSGGNPFVNELAGAITYQMIQEEVWNPSCDGCHDNNSPSAGLDLTVRGNSYANLVNQESRRLPGAIFVIPFDADSSYLVQKMEGAPGIVGSRMSAGAERNQMVRDWIEAGAPNN